MKEINALQARDIKQRLKFENIYAADFVYRYPYIDIVKADHALHGQLADGSMIYGLDVTAKAWALVDAHRWIQVLRWPVIRWFTDIGYRSFAD
ncbi:MAG: DCC1-like thiol-disulfide oxidoreductase family protein [Methylophaga sp.]